MLAYTPLLLRWVLALAMAAPSSSSSALPEARADEQTNSNIRSQRRFVALDVIAAENVDAELATQVRVRARAQLAGANLFIDDASSVVLRIDLQTSSSSVTDFPYAIVLDGEVRHRGDYTCKDCSIPTLLADIEAHVAEVLPKLSRAAEDELEHTNEPAPAPLVATPKSPKESRAQKQAANMTAAGLVLTTVGGAAVLGGVVTDIVWAVKAKKPETTVPRINYVGGGVAIGAGVAVALVGVGLLVAGRRRGGRLFTRAPSVMVGNLVGLAYGGRF